MHAGTQVTVNNSHQGNANLNNHPNSCHLCTNQIHLRMYQCTHQYDQILPIHLTLPPLFLPLPLPFPDLLVRRPLLPSPMKWSLDPAPKVGLVSAMHGNSIMIFN